jgi:tRNA A37 N6-isopentenylltransferase MiaA
MTEQKRRESIIRNELTRLAAEHGGELQPKAVVDAARPDTSPLHNSFDWDDSEAAEKWRLQQARQLIRAVVIYEHVGKKSMPVRVFVSLTPDREENGAGYRLANVVLADAAHRQQMLSDALAEMQRFRLKYQRLSELAKVFEAMDEVTTPELAHTA